MSRTKDFDEFIAERDDWPLIARWDGQDWELPPRLPAATQLRIRRARMALMVLARAQHEAEEKGIPLDDVEISDTDATLIAEAEKLDLEAEMRKQFGDEIIDAWLERGIDSDTLNAIWNWAVGEYLGETRDEDDAEDDAEGEAKAPEAGAQESKTSSKGGVTSKSILPSSTPKSISKAS